MKNILSLIALLFCVMTTQAQLPSSNFFGPDQNVCPGGAGLGFNSGQPLFNPNWTYLWSTGETTSQIFYPYPNAGVYTVWCKVSLNGQSVTDTIHYNVYPSVDVPPISSSSQTGCVDSGVLTTPYLVNHTYQWYKANPAFPGTYTILSGQTNNSLVVTSTSEYKVKVTNPGGCFNENTIFVSTLGNPKKYLHDTVLCKNAGPYIIIADNKNTNCTYLWNQGNTGNEWVINPNQIGTNKYWVQITNSNGCTITDTINYTINPLPNPLLNSNVPLYPGTSVTLKDISPEDYSHVWRFNNSIISTQDSVVVNYPGTFNVVTTNIYGCSKTNNVTVVSKPSPKVSGISYNIPNLDQPRKVFFRPLNDSNVVNFLWNFGDGTTSNMKTPTHLFEGTYTQVVVQLTVSNQYTSQTVNVIVDLTNQTTSINDIENEVGLNIYPNPVVNDLNITLKNSKIKTVVLTDISGRVLKTYYPNNYQFILNMTMLPSGLYYTKIHFMYNNKEGIITKKVIK